MPPSCPRQRLASGGVRRAYAILSAIFPKECKLPSIGVPELLLILGIALLIFGPRKLPELGSALGRTIKEFKKGVKEEASASPEEKK
jgi:sec-independent protein translocase protein TatA